MSIIAIAGRAGSGKDTVGKIIQCLYYLHKNNIKVLTVLELLNDKNLDLNLSGWQVKKFADKLKDIVCILIGCTREQLEDPVFKETELGEEWRRYYFAVSDVRSEKAPIKISKYYSSEKEAWESDNNLILYGSGESKEIHPLISEVLTPRLILQNLGTEGGRDAIHPSIWVNSLMSEYVAHPKGTAHDLKDWSELYTHKECKNCKKQYNGWKRQYLCKECIEDDSIQFYPNWLITDMRFPNEYDAVKSRGGIAIRVVREFYEFSNNDHEWGDKECRQGKLLKVNADYYSKEESNKVWRDFLKENAHKSETALDDHQFDYEIINDSSIEDLIEKVKQILITEKII
jgi:hypothetical protein